MKTKILIPENEKTYFNNNFHLVSEMTIDKIKKYPIDCGEYILGFYIGIINSCKNISVIRMENGKKKTIAFF